jgi:MMP 1-O-methyltransferase
MKSRRQLLSYLRERAKTRSDINEHLELLYQMVAKTGAQRIVELGTRGGNSTCALVIGAAETKGRVVSVDHGRGSEYPGEPPTWNQLAETTTLITDKLGLEDFWQLVVKDDLRFASQYKNEIDLLFIDTGHSYEQTKKELQAWGRKVVNGGFIAIHDTVSFPEQNKAIWEFLDANPFCDYVEHRNCNGLGIIIKDTGPPRRSRTVRNERSSAIVWQDRINRLQEGILEIRARLKMGLAEQESTIQSLKAENARLTEDLKMRIAQQESTIQSLKAENARLTEDLRMARRDLVSTSAEIAAIKGSLGYRFMRLYGKWIDKIRRSVT